MLTYNMNTKNWMKDLNDDLSLSKLSIIGTNNSVSGESIYNFNTIGKICALGIITQRHNIVNQLNKGIRYLDIKIKKDNTGDINVYNKYAYLGLSLRNVLDKCVAFIANNPSEFIILSVNNIMKFEQFSDEHINFINEINSIFNFYENHLLFFESKSLKVKNLRGKILLLDSSSNNSLYNIHFGNSDRLATEKDITKQYFDIIKGELDSTSWEKDVLCLLHCNCKGSFPILEYIPYFKHINFPYRSASKLNNLFKKYFKTTYLKNAILITDFPDDDLIKKIIDSNFI